MKKTLPYLFLLLGFTAIGQNEILNYQLNGRASNKTIEAIPHESKNPFASFIGEWTLDEDTWIQNWGGNNDTIKIPFHHTISNKLNTDNSLLSIIDGPEPNGHIFWSYNPVTKQVNHLSSFGDIRSGVGQGVFYGNGNLRLKISFEGEAPGTYRIYTYEWIDKDKYALNSIQYNESDEPTGLFYKGDFVRINKTKDIRTQIEHILAILDNNTITKEEQMEVYSEDIIHMAPNHKVIDNKSELLQYLKDQTQYGYSNMEHSIRELEDVGSLVIMRGQVKGIYHSKQDGSQTPFQTKNLFVFVKEKDALKIQKVIYNMSPVE